MKSPLKHTSIAAVLSLTALAGCGTANSLPSANTGAAGAKAYTTLSVSQAKMADAVVDAIGVNTHFPYDDTVYNQYDKIKAKLLDAGIRHLRDGAGKTSEIKFQTIYKRLQELGGLGIKTTLIMNDKWGVLPTDAPAIASAAAGGIEAFEGPNECDIASISYKGQGFPGGLRAYSDDLVAAAKSTGLPVAAPSMAHPENNSKLGALSGLNLGNMHSYPGGYEPTNGLDSRWLPQTRLTSGSLPIISTETGYHNGIGIVQTAIQPGVSEAVAGQYMPRLYLEYFTRGIVRAYPYELIDEWNDPGRTDAEKNFGLLHNDLTEKPAFTATKNLIAVLKDPGPAFATGSLDYGLEGDTSGVKQQLLQKRDGSFYLVLWQDARLYDPTQRKDLAVTTKNVTVRLNSAIASAEVYKPSTQAAATQTLSAPTSVAVPLAGELVIVKLKPGTGTAPAPTVAPTATPTTAPTPAPTATPSTAPSGAADLVVTDFTPVSATVGAPTSFRVTVKNQGGTATPAGTVLGVGLYANGQPVAWSDTSTASLGAGQSVTLTTNKAWTPTTAGTVAVTAHVDDVNRISESNEANNTLAKNVAVGTAATPTPAPTATPTPAPTPTPTPTTTAKADLVFSSASWSPSSPTAGQSVRFSFVVRNAGNAATPSGVVIPVGIYNASNQLVAWSNTTQGPLAAGASMTLVTNQNWTAVRGAQTLTAVLDPNKTLVESNTTNNRLRGTITVR